MFRGWKLHPWLVVALCWAVVLGVSGTIPVAQGQPAARSQVRLMFLFKGAAQESNPAVENALTRAFQSHGYSVVDAGTVAQTLRRNADLLQLYEVEAAKRLGARLGADIVVSGESKTRVSEKTYEILGGKKVTVTQADITAKAILVNSGKVLVADSAHARKPFDTTGEIGLQTAAEALAGKLLQGIEAFLARDTIDYRLLILNISAPQSLTLQEAIRSQVQGVRQVTEQGFIKNILELQVSVEKRHDSAFKRSLFTQLSGLGLGRFEVVAREGETIYLRRMSNATVQAEHAGSGEGRKPTALPPSPSAEQPTAPRSETPPGVSGAGATPQTAMYKSGYRKSWAVVIGINNYEKWPKLEYAVNDAQAIGNLLKKKFGFDEVLTIFNGEATQQKILRVLGDELFAKTQDEDRVVIFFAGHGQTQDLPNGSKVGYIIPVEGETNNYYSTAISVRQLQDLSDRLRAKHIFFAMDSCFSGLLMRLRGGEPDAYAAMPQTTASVRQVLTAGSEGEQVVEMEGHGLFTKVLLSALEGEADLNRDGRITASELYQFLAPRVLEQSQNRQNPVFGRLGTGQGEFIF